MFGVSGTHACRIAAALAAATLVSSCIAVGPDFLRPAAPSTDRYTKEPLAAATAAAPGGGGSAQRFHPGGDIPQQWWKLFRSPALNSLIARALKANPNVQAALASLRAAKELVYAQQGKYFPLVEANFNPTRQQTSSSLTPIPASGANVFDLHTAQVLVSYNLDVWGRNRRTVESLEAQADAQRFQFEAAYLSLTANLVVAAVQEASLRAQIDATNQLIGVNTGMLDIMRRQLDAGYANRSDVAVQEAALAQIRAALPQLRKLLALQRDLLAALAGGYPSVEPFEKFTLEALHLPEDLPVSLPSQLIEQRPDVRTAEEQLRSASAQVGVATANMLPNFSISANGGYTATALAGLLSPANAFWLLAGNLTQPVFDGTSLLHMRRNAEANYDQAAWLYRSTVIGALQNVADALRAIQFDAEALQAAREFERAAQTSFSLARQQVEAGNANALLLLNGQQTYLNSVLAVVRARADRLADTAALFQALGGGWWNRSQPPSEKILDVGAEQPVTLLDPYNFY